jgi:hypothetical protein
MSIRMDLHYRESNPNAVYLGNSRKQIHFDWKEVGNPTLRGRNGQVKKGGFFGRSISIGAMSLNRGSFIDCLNTFVEVINTQHQLPKLQKIEKGGVFFGGASDQEIQNLFTKVQYELALDKSLLVKVRDFKPVSVSLSPVGLSSETPFIGHRPLI